MDVTAYMTKTIQQTNGAATCWAMSVAKDTGLLEIFLKDHQPMTVEEIATKANLKQRYVKEILGCLVTSGTIEIDDESTKYHVPEVYRSSLLQFSHNVGIMSFVQDRKEDVKACMDPAGPSGYASQTKPNYMDALTFLRPLSNDDLLEEDLFSSTEDILSKLESGIDFIEFGCGESVGIIELASRYPNSRFIASDYSSQVVATVNKTITSKSLTNIRAEQADLYDLPSSWTNKYDVAYVRDVIHDLGDPVRGLVGIYNTIKNGGFLNIIDLDIKGSNHKENKQDAIAPMAFAISSSICVPESLGQTGGLGLGCCLGIRTLDSLFEKAQIPQSKIVTTHLKSKPFQVKFVCRK